MSVNVCYRIQPPFGGFTEKVEGEHFFFTGKIKYERDLLEGGCEIYFEINIKFNMWEKPHWYSISRVPIETLRAEYMNSSCFMLVETTVEECTK